MADAFASDRYELRRKLFTFVHIDFFIHGPNGDVVLWGRKKGFRLKEDIRLYADAGMTRQVMAIEARSAIDFSGSYDVSADGRRIAVLRRKGLRSLLRDEWHILGENEQPLAIVQEDSQALALLRRFLSNLIPQAFHITINNSPVGEIKQNFNPFLMKLTIDFTLDSRRQLDRRIGLAAAVLLGTVEGRQKD